MTNPFATIDARLANIEDLLLSIKHDPPQQPTAQPQDRLLTIQEAAEFLHLSVPTMYDKVSKRQLPHHKRGKRLYFSLDDLTAYVKAGTRAVKQKGGTR